MNKIEITNETLNTFADVSRDALLVTLEVRHDIECEAYDKKVCPAGTRAIGIIHDNEIDVYHETAYVEYDSNWLFNRGFYHFYKIITKQDR